MIIGEFAIIRENRVKTLLSLHLFSSNYNERSLKSNLIYKKKTYNKAPIIDKALLFITFMYLQL